MTLIKSISGIRGTIGGTTGDTLNPLDIVVVSFVLADDGIPISSTRIRQGKINQKGELI